MIVRAFLAIATFLLILTIIMDEPGIHLLNKQMASKQKTKANSQKKRGMELNNPKLADPSKEEEFIIMNDPEIYKKWGLKNLETFYAWGVHKFWEQTTENRKIVVAVVDTGIDISHPDLKKNLWRNPGETGKDRRGRNKATNGIDDDGNGLIDDVHGWNFVHNNNYLMDNHGHGTHIAGIIGAEGDNHFGVTGVAPNVSLMILKYFDPKSPGNNLTNTIKSFDYATKMGAHIINYSGGGLEYSHPEFLAVQRAQQKGILFVAAAGNEQTNSDVNKYYPADYELDNIISVTATEVNDQVLSSSNYGKKTVDIAAPGESICSTIPGGVTGKMTGTSQATAFVSGVAALLMSMHTDFNGKKVRTHILNTGIKREHLKSKTKTSRVLNAYRALTISGRQENAFGGVAENTSQEANEFNAPSDGPQKTSLSGFGQSLEKALYKIKRGSKKLFRKKKIKRNPTSRKRNNPTLSQRKKEQK